MQQTVLVTGASGFLGSAVLETLLSRGYHVRAFVRSETSPLPMHPNVERCIGNIHDEKAVLLAMSGASSVVHLAAAKSDEKDSYETNVLGAKNVIEACRKAGVKRVVHVSTQSAKLARKGRYASTKSEADTLFAAAPLDVTILLPSLIYGDKTSGVFGTILRCSKLPIVPLIGNGRATFRPIHRNDFAEIIVHALEDQKTIGRTYDIGGPDMLDLNTLTEKIMQAQGQTRPVVHLPLWFSLFAAKILSVLPKPPLTVSNVLGSAVDTPMTMDAMLRDFRDVPIRSFSKGLQDLFGPAPTREQKEAKVLLSYVLSPFTEWQPDEQIVALCLKAYRVHGVEKSVLSDRLLESRRKLRAADTATRLRFPESVLRKKLLITAAIAECNPVSAEVLLPQDRAPSEIFWKTLGIGFGALGNILLTLPYILFPFTLKRDAGTV